MVWRWKMTLSDLAIKHPYYASDSNYFSNEAGHVWNKWEDFYEEYHDADIDMNFVYRWDVGKYEERDNSGDGYYLEIFIIGQRKGIYSPHIIKKVEEKDVEQIVSYLNEHKQVLFMMWEPLIPKT
jgi:hypothetical protein